MVHALAQLTVVKEEVRLALELDNGMMRRPPEDGLEDAAAVRKGAEGVLAGGEAQKMRVPRRVGKVVRVAALV